MISVATNKNYRSDTRPDLERERRQRELTSYDDFEKFDSCANSVEGTRGTYFDRDHWLKHYTLRRKRKPLSRKAKIRRRQLREFTIQTD